ncbi:MAG: hydroxyacylglutathione hydrolase [Aquabacterium sp.]|uniref:hydroxyacylglutathione hydrolase n=1 Tax=Aquabacterium sp. TaxID=1872578 RepID=UPI0012215D30|nr:hydroxyacylglutathione hydrolase [Aquabacterium sp.]TAK95998.1 MAG: hydroxyacylglutathione hydrolase [Aquabacterium sp.]
MELLALPAFTDNYIWMLHNGQQALVVDPGDAAPVLDTLQQRRLTLTAILVTHHHPDHTAGLQALQSDHTAVYGPRHEAISGITHRVGEGDIIQWAGLHIHVLDTPGHTAGHIAYLVPPEPDQSLPDPTAFVGDTLFSAGCGRLFDGTMAQLYASLTRLKDFLPDATRICAAHEYTLSNLRFAKAVEPNNLDLGAYQAHCEALRARALLTLPGTMRNEKAINPFLRCTEPEVVSSALQHGATDASPEAVFAALRLWKNTF